MYPLFDSPQPFYHTHNIIFKVGLSYSAMYYGQLYIFLGRLRLKALINIVVFLHFSNFILFNHVYLQMLLRFALIFVQQ